MKMPNDASTMLMFTIVNRGLGEKIIHLFTEHGVTYNLLMLGRGTASTEILEYLGLGATEKELLLSLTPRYIAKELLMQLDEKLNLNKPGSGIAFTVPLSSVAGSIAINYVKGLPQPETGSEDHMEQECNHDLIITIVDRGYSDEVMHAAVQQIAALNPVYWGLEALTASFMYQGEPLVIPFVALLIIGSLGMMLGIQGLRRMAL
jgi:hypothetical protein